MGKGIGGHEKTLGINNEWLTPPEIIKSLGDFDLDPCAPVNRPWDTAKLHYTEQDDGLFLPWAGRCWLNPPYDRRQIHLWMKKMAEHSNGVSLIFARTETQFFQQYVFAYCSSLLFIEGRIRFYDVTGKPGEFTGGAPSVLVAYGKENVASLGDSGIKGAHLLVNYTPVVVVGISPTWRSVITVAVSRAGGEADLKVVYELVEQIAPDKTERNEHWKEKVRQELQYHFTRIAKGRYSNKTV